MSEYKKYFWIARVYPQVGPLPCTELVRAMEEDGTIHDGFYKIEDAVAVLERLQDQYPHFKFELTTKVNMPLGVQ